jgi:undecaprenyl diphosphate synthase
VGIILDGNRRWAKEKGLPSLAGHTEGLDNLERAAEWIKNAGVRHLVVYAFSTENWRRSPEEVSHLLGLFLKAAREQLARLSERQVRVRFVGERERFSQELRDAMREVEEKSARGTFTLWVCLSYGGRAEIVEAARAMQHGAEEITEESFAKHLWTAGMPDPDIVIRTGGAKRLSNFLLWQSAYSELFFVDTYWPDFSEAELKRILDDYGARERRMGR